MDKKAVIPTQPLQRWREFRFTTVPIATVLTVLTAVILLWNQIIFAPTIVGPAESRRVTSPSTGYITNLHVTRFQTVQKGDLIAEVVSNDNKWKAAKLEPLIIRAPISGTVSMVYRSQGETVLAGEPIVAIKETPAPEVAALRRSTLDQTPLAASEMLTLFHRGLVSEAGKQIAVKSYLP